MDIYFLSYCVIGYLLMFFLRKFPPAAKIANKWETTKELFNCDLCLGFWTYFLLSFLFGIDIFNEFFYYPVVSQVLTAAITSFLVFLVVEGWKSRFTVMVVD